MAYEVVGRTGSFSIRWGDLNENGVSRTMNGINLSGLSSIDSIAENNPNLNATEAVLDGLASLESAFRSLAFTNPAQKTGKVDSYNVKTTFNY